MYEESGDLFENTCQEVASEVSMFPEFVSLLREVAKQKHVRAVVVTAGIRRIWEKVLENEGLSAVKVIGGGRIEDGFVVTAAVKAALIDRLRETHHMYVWAFGDSVLDLDMMKKADQAIVVVGEEHTRRDHMETALEDAISNHGLKARQALLPSNVSPRVDTTRLPVVKLDDPKFVNSILCARPRRSQKLFHATGKNTAKVLMTPTRDAAVSGLALREAHRRIGFYLATEFLADIIGVKECPITHVQGQPTTGHRLRDEKKTLIVALMRGGEPMAFGVNDALPLAMFFHAKDPEDLKLRHLQGISTVVLVDSVVNSGKSVVEFVEHIRKQESDSAISIVVVSGVVQAQSISEGDLAKLLADDEEFSVVALRISDNKFTGRGTTDTGNRLFNTTHLTS